MSALKINHELLRQFEQGLDPWNPEKSSIPAKVMGYGEISTVFAIESESERELAYKRMPLFKTEQEADRYEALYRQYLLELRERAGLNVVESDITRIVDEVNQRTVVYIVQQRLPSHLIGNAVIQHLSAGEIRKLVLRVLNETAKVFDYNLQNKGKLEIGFDGQISNWALIGLDPNKPDLGVVELVYFDTSSPLICIDGKEQLDAELFLRSAPSFLVWILRLFFLQDVMSRYYDFRKVSIDLIANFYKEQRAEVIPDLVEIVNDFFAGRNMGGSFKPLTAEEIKAYYQEDAWIWRLYLAFRKVDRFIHRLLGKYYPYVLPENIKR